MLFAVIIAEYTLIAPHIISDISYYTLDFYFLPFHHFDPTKKLTRDSFFSVEQSSFKTIEQNRNLLCRKASVPKTCYRPLRC
jgi:hypothetical protein